MHLVTPAPGTFTTEELARLAVYRAAVEAGFYTDDVPGVAVEVDNHQSTETEANAESEGATSEQLGR